MAVRVNPKLIDELEHYGAQDVIKCYHCGNCSAACPFSKEPFIFPRRSMRYLQMGLEQRLKGTLEPWLCYYCGECSEECPRGAEPGETMMSMRRWLTAKYDFTGIAELFYRSWKAELWAIIIVAFLTGFGLLLFGFKWGGGNLSIYDGAQAFLPSSAIHIFDWSMAGLLLVLLFFNSFRMWYFVVKDQRFPKITLSIYVKKLYTLFLHFFTQKRYSECEKKRPWFLHLILMLSYVTMLILIMFFLREVQDGPAINWHVHIFGYLAAIGLIVTVILSIRGRIKKTDAHHKHSHESDWMFLILLIIVCITGVLQHILHRVGLNAPANIMYILHMMSVVPMLVLEVPFSKWSHLAYRTFAIYFSELETEALKQQAKKKETASAGKDAQVTQVPQMA